MGSKNNIIAALDLGTSNVRMIAVTPKQDRANSIKDFSLLGSACVPSRGLRKGVVVNIDLVVEAITDVLAQLEKQIGAKISEVVLAVSGAHLECYNCSGEIVLRTSEVSSGEIRRVIERAQTLLLEKDREILHVLPQEFIVDGQDGIKEPLGMSCRKLASRVHIVTGSETTARNVVKCANRAGLTVRDLVVSPIATWKSIPSMDEQELGVAIIDIGAGTTDLAVLYRGALMLSASFPFGGNHISNDLATGLKTSLAVAEQIKCTYGCAWQSYISAHEQVDIPSASGKGTRQVSRMHIAEIIEARVIEILGLVNRHLHETGAISLLNAGIILTGGGASLVGIEKAAERIFSISVRVSNPKFFEDVELDSGYATAIGLVNFIIDNQGASAVFKPEKGIRKVFAQVNSWFSENI